MLISFSATGHSVTESKDYSATHSQADICRIAKSTYSFATTNSIEHIHKVRRHISFNRNTRLCPTDSNSRIKVSQRHCRAGSIHCSYPLANYARHHDTETNSSSACQPAPILSSSTRSAVPDNHVYLHDLAASSPREAKDQHTPDQNVFSRAS